MYLAYKITNVENGKYYLGVHEGIPGDEYPGSGKMLHQSYRKRLGEHWTWSDVWQSGIYTKEICEYFDNESDMYCWEVENVTELEVKDEMCYNMILGGRGWSHTHNIEEIRKKMSEAQKIRFQSEEERRKVSEAKKGNQYALGHHHTEETRKQISEIHKGKHRSEETRRKMSEAKKGHKYNLGRQHSEETKRKISENLKGHYVTKEARQKMSESRKGEKNYFYGKQFTEEHKRKLSESLKGHDVTEETRQKISEAAKKRLKFQWKDSEGNIHIMTKNNAMRFHPDWVLINE